MQMRNSHQKPVNIWQDWMSTDGVPKLVSEKGYIICRNAGDFQIILALECHLEIVDQLN